RSELLLAGGVLAKETHGNTIRLAPPLIITESELDWALDRIEAAVSLSGRAGSAAWGLEGLGVGGIARLGGLGRAKWPTVSVSCTTSAVRAKIAYPPGSGLCWLIRGLARIAGCPVGRRLA